MVAPPLETQERQYTDRDIGIIEGRQEQGLKRLEDLIEAVQELNRKADRQFLMLITAMIALMSITIGGFITLATMILTVAGR